MTKFDNLLVAERIKICRKNSGYSQEELANLLGMKRTNIANYEAGRIIPPGKGSTQETRIFTEDGIYEVTMLSKQPKARAFRAFVRKTLKALRKGEMVLVQPQTDNSKLEIQRMRAEAMLNNSRTRQAKLILDMQQNKTLSPIAIELLQINALEVLGDKAIEHRPEVEKSYTATELGGIFGVSAQKIGKLANAHNLKTNEYGYFALDKSLYSNKQVESFRYFERGKEKIQELLGVI